MNETSLQAASAPSGQPDQAGQASAVPELLPARMLNEFVYCPRLFYYEWVEGLFAESADTVEGALRHAKFDKGPTPFPTAEAAAEAGKDKIHGRSLTLSSQRHGLIAKIDRVEGEGGVVSPVDYKHGAPRQGEDVPEL